VKKERKARLITIALLAGVTAIVIARKADWKLPAARTIAQGEAQATPQDAIYNMLDAAREGAVGKYLSAYTGQMERSLKQAIAESSEEKFANYLRQSNAPIKGIAITEPQPLTDREMKVRVEYVYQDRNEIQVMYLEKVADTWKIARVDATERVKTLVPYGTPVQ
jgi:hypothetical protein